MIFFLTAHMRHLILLASIIVVSALAMRPKLSLALLTTVPVSVAIAESRAPGGLPDWILVTGFVVTAYCLAAVLVALFFRRSGDIGGYFGTLPIGREAKYSSADKAGLWYTFILLSVAAGASVVAAYDPPYDSFAVRVIALLLIPVFAGLAYGFWLLLKDRDVIIRIHEDGLEVIDGSGSARHIPWNDVAGHTFWFGIFRVYDKQGRRLLRVDNTIDGFVSLLYHVNRRTFRAG